MPTNSLFKQFLCHSRLNCDRWRKIRKKKIFRFYFSRRLFIPLSDSYNASEMALGFCDFIVVAGASSMYARKNIIIFSLRLRWPVKAY